MATKKLAFLTCKDLSDFSVDDQIFYDLLKQKKDLNFEVLPWDVQGVDWSSFDCAIIRTTWDYTENLESFLNRLKYIEEQGCKLINSHELIQWNANKKYLLELEAQGVRLPQSYFLGLSSKQELDKLLERKQEDFVLKPVVGASAGKIEILKSQDLIHRLSELQPKKWFLQKFHPEIFEGELSFFFFEDNYSHAVTKKPKSGDYRVQEEHGGLIQAYKPQHKELEWARKVLSCVPQSYYYARVDAIYIESKLHLMELELIEPAMYFSICPESAQNMLTSMMGWIKKI